MSERISDEMLSAYFDGEASPSEVARIERSLESNPELAKKLDEWKAVRHAIKQLPTYRPSDGMYRSIMSAISRSQSVPLGDIAADPVTGQDGNGTPNSSLTNEDRPHETHAHHSGSSTLDSVLESDQHPEATVELPHSRNSANHRRWAIALFTTVAALLVLVVFYNPGNRSVETANFATDDAEREVNESLERQDDESTSSNGPMPSVERSRSSDDSIAAPFAMSQSLGSEKSAPGKAAGVEPVPSAGFGGGQRRSLAQNADRSQERTPENPAPPGAAEGGFGGGGGAGKGGELGLAQGGPPGSGAGRGGRVRISTADEPGEMNRKAPTELEFPARGRGGRESVDAAQLADASEVDAGIEPKSGAAADAPAGQSIESFSRDANEQLVGRIPMGRFYAVIDHNSVNAIERRLAPAPNQTESGAETDWQSNDAMDEQQASGQPKSRSAGPASVPSLPMQLRNLGFVQVERMENEQRNKEQQLGILEQIVANEDTTARFRLLQDAFAAEESLAQLDEQNSSDKGGQEQRLSQRPDSSLSKSSPESGDVALEALGTTIDTRVEFYEFEADAASVNQMIVLFAEQGASVDLFYKQPVVGAVVRGGSDEDPNPESKRADFERRPNVVDETQAPRRSGGDVEAEGNLALSGVPLDTDAEAPGQHDQPATEWLEPRLGWDAVKMFPLADRRRVDSLAMRQRQLLAEQVQPGDMQLGNAAAGRPADTPRENNQAGEVANQANVAQAQPAGSAEQMKMNDQSGAAGGERSEFGSLGGDQSYADGQSLGRQQDTGDASGKKTMTIEDLTRSQVSYFWRGQSYVESTTIVQHKENDDDRDAIDSDQRPRPPRPLRREPEIDSKAEPRNMGTKSEQQRPSAPSESTINEVRRLVPQFSRPGRVRLTLIVRTPVHASPSSRNSETKEANEAPLPASGSSPRE